MAHLGIKIPVGAFMTLDGQKIEWEEGRLTVFDDSFLHSVKNPSDQARFILHVAFPHPDIPTDTAPILLVEALHFRLRIYANCTAVATNLRTLAASKPVALVSLYNRVSDNRLTDSTACIGASLAAPGVVRIVAAYGYGTVDSESATSNLPWLVIYGSIIQSACGFWVYSERLLVTQLG